jgi:RNA recognition motif-containing protein
VLTLLSKVFTKEYLKNLLRLMLELYNAIAEAASSKIVTDKFNGNRSKGFGFVEMSDDEAGRTAISQLNESDIMGRKIVINEPQPRPKDGSGGVDLRREASAAKAKVAV